MKKGILIILLAVSGMAQAQSLKEALYSGRLKTDPGTVIRKGDDLSTKMDTARRVPTADTSRAVAQAKAAEERKYTAPMDLTTMTRNSNTANTTTPAASNTGAAPRPTTDATADTAAVASVSGEQNNATVETAPEASAAPKDNNAAWKDYMNTVVAALKTDALNARKVKKGTYYASVSYTIETDGQVTVNDVLLTPENDGLKKAIRDKVVVDAPRLSPVLNSSGTPRKVTRKYNFTLTKE